MRGLLGFCLVSRLYYKTPYNSSKKMFRLANHRDLLIFFRSFPKRHLFAINLSYHLIGTRSINLAYDIKGFHLRKYFSEVEPLDFLLIFNLNYRVEQNSPVAHPFGFCP